MTALISLIKLLSMANSTAYTLFMIADNETGVLARVTALFSARGYLIQSLTAGEIDAAKHLSCITITTFGTPAVVDQIRAQVLKIIAIREVIILSSARNSVQREMMLGRVSRSETQFQKMVDQLEMLDARQMDANENGVTYELSGEPAAIDQYIAQLRALGEIEIVRSGIIGLADFATL